MNPWKISTFVLAAVLLAAITLNWRARDSANNASTDAAKVQAELTPLRSAVNDTQAYLNWYRLNQSDGLTQEDLDRNIVILRNKYLHYFPDWAEIQTD